MVHESTDQGCTLYAKQIRRRMIYCDIETQWNTKDKATVFKTAREKQRLTIKKQWSEWQQTSWLWQEMSKDIDISFSMWKKNYRWWTLENWPQQLASDSRRLSL